MNNNTLEVIRDIIVLGFIPFMTLWFKYRQFQNTKVIAATHKLVNSAMETQLMLTYTALKRYSDLSENPEDIKLTEAAKLAYDNHVAKQVVVDAGTPTVKL